tara:strand:- start:359 stop:535 length:177 start_codon:yes stop_codon:yes gene_type:complete
MPPTTLETLPEAVVLDHHHRFHFVTIRRKALRRTFANLGPTLLGRSPLLETLTHLSTR